MVSTSRRLACLLLGASALLAAATPFALAQDAKLRPVSLFMYSVAPDLGDAPLWIVPHALGYFADEGLQVGVEYAGGSSGASCWRPARGSSPRPRPRRSCSPPIRA